MKNLFSTYCPVFRYGLNRIKSAFVLFVLLLGMTLAVSAGAREMVVDFVRQIRGDDVEYAFYGDSDSDIDPSALPSLKVAQYYFRDLNGDWYMTSLFTKWADERGIDVSDIVSIKGK